MTQTRLLARKVARELTPAELQLVSGGSCGDEDPPEAPDTGGSYTGTGCGYTGFWNTYACSDLEGGGGGSFPEPPMQDPPCFPE